MNKQLGFLIVLINILFYSYSFSQDSLKNAETKPHSNLFLDEEPLPIKLSFSIKEIKKYTNDSSYMDTNLSYQLKDGSWENLEIKLRARGNYRRKNCYFPPLKIKLKKRDLINTPFEGNNNLKIAIPCLLQKDKNDNVIKEYLAYKLFELISPYHFKTRSLNITLAELKGKKIKLHTLKGILIEDNKNVAQRFDGRIFDRYSHPLNHEPLASVRSSIFQYMIGNTDYSQAYLHNIKVIYVDKKLIPLPYDFDMSGFVNSSYAVVSQIEGESLGMTSVRDRKYRGFVRDEFIFNQVRNEMLSQKEKMILLLNSCESYFEDPEEFRVAKEYILDFFTILDNKEKFESEIINQARKG